MSRNSKTDVLAQPAEFTGRIMLSDDTLSLAANLSPGDIAIINHPDLDRASALALVESKPALVLNAAPSITGRYPNRGPHVLLEAHVPLIDNLGTAILGLKSGQKVTVRGGQVFLAGRLLAEGRVVTRQSYSQDAKDARFGMADRLESFAANTKEFLNRERDFMFDGEGLGHIKLDCNEKIVVVVGPGVDATSQLASLRVFIREHRPVLVGVGSGSDLLVQAGYKPDLLTGNLNAASDAAVRSGGEIVIHSAFQDTVKDQRLDSIGLHYSTVTSGFTDFDVALLIALHHGAKLVIPVGDFSSFDDFLDQGRQGMTSSFFAHLLAQGKIVPPQGVNILFSRPLRFFHVFVLLVCAFIALAVAISFTPFGQSVWLWGGQRSWLIAAGGLAFGLILLLGAGLVSLWRKKND